MSDSNSQLAERPSSVPAWAARGYGFALVFGGRYAAFTDGLVIRMACELKGRSNCVRRCPEKRLRQFNCNNGYLCVTIAHRGITSRRSVHSVICSAFHGEQQPGQEVNHLNGLKKDNRALNLEWQSRRGNQQHAADTGLKPTGERSHLAKLSESAVTDIRQRLAIGQSQQSIANIHHVSQTCISKIATRKKWKQFQS